jgi:hypothetical protein
MQLQVLQNRANFLKSCKACKTLGKGFGESYIRLEYETCTDLGPTSSIDLCYDYEAKGHECPEHGTAYLEEPYDHVSINVSYPDNLEQYVAWDLRRCFGTTQNASSLNGTNKQGNSTTKANVIENDTSLTLPVTAEILADIIESISFDRNITIAKLYLDNIYKHRTLDIIDTVSDRFPPNIIALFNAAIEHIRQQPKHVADIALLAIAAAGEDGQGISLSTLDDWMHDAISRLPHLANAPPRSLEDILLCANGFLYEIEIEIEADEPDRYVSTYNSHFARYVKENYNETIFWARSQLNIRRAARKLTTIVPTPPRLTSPPMVTSPPSMDGSFDVGIYRPVQLQGSPPEYFDRSFRSGGYRLPPKSQLSLPALPRWTDAELELKKLRPANRTFTMLPGRRNKFSTGIGKIPGETKPLEHDKPRLSHSIHR